MKHQLIKKLFPKTYMFIITQGFSQGKTSGRARMRNEILEELEAFGVEKFNNDEMTLGFNQAVGIVKKV